MEKGILLCRKEYTLMGELKTDLFPSNLYRAREEAKRKTESIAENSVQPAVALPESEKTGKDGSGGE